MKLTMRVVFALLATTALADETAQSDPCACKEVWTQFGYQELHYCNPVEANGGTTEECNDREHLDLKIHLREDCEADNKCNFDEGAEKCMEKAGCSGSECDGAEENWCEVVDPAACAAINENEAEVFVWSFCSSNIGGGDGNKLPAPMLELQKDQTKTSASF